MRRTAINISEVIVHGRTRYCVTTPKAHGPGRERKFFETKKEAETHLKKKKEEVATHGLRALALSERDRADYLWAMDTLKPHGLSLRDALGMLMPQLEAQERGLTVKTLATRFVESKRKGGNSKKHIYTIEKRLERFGLTFGERTVASITHGEVEIWLHTQPALGPQSANHYAATLHSFFAYGVKLGTCVKNPVAGIEKQKVTRPAPGILTPGQLGELLKASAEYPEIRAYAALGAFAGLRSAEALRLEWEDVDFATGYLTVNARHAKTSRRRLIPINDALRAWMLPLVKEGRIVPLSNGTFTARWRKVRKAAKMFEGWEGNELRHSYATYRLAETADPARTASEMGHSPIVLKEHYARLVTPAAAATYFATLPEDGEKIVSLPAVSAAA